MRDKNNEYKERQNQIDLLKEQIELNKKVLEEFQQQLASLSSDKKVGRKTHKPTEATRLYVLQQAGNGVPQDMIANALDISDDTLRKYYQREFKKGKAIATTMVANSLFSRAVAGDFKSQQLYLTTQAKWTTATDDINVSAEERNKVLDSGLMDLLGIAQNTTSQQEKDDDLDFENNEEINEEDY